MTPQEIFEQALGYYKGHKEEDYKKAYPLFLEAAEFGHIEAQSYVGRMLSWGEGIEQNYSEAAIWLRSAAEKGDAKAQARLGHLQMFGKIGRAHV